MTIHTFGIPCDLCGDTRHGSTNEDGEQLCGRCESELVEPPAPAEEE